MAYGEPELQAGTIIYHMRVNHVNGFFSASIQGSAVEDMNTGTIDEAAADAAFQQLLDVLGDQTDLTVTLSQKQYVSEQPVSLTPPAE